MKLLQLIGTFTRTQIILMGIGLLGLIGFIDFLLGYDYNISSFYLLPIMLLTWSQNFKYGFVFAITSILVWITADIIIAGNFVSYSVHIWNSFIRLSSYAIIILIIEWVKHLMIIEKIHANRDFLTGVHNAKAFYHIAEDQLEYIKSQKSFITIVFIDLDNFKYMNDTFGHQKGDEVLKEIANAINANIRSTDCLGRLGGDEFAIILPETADTTAIQIVERIQKTTKELTAEKNWPISMSIGVATFKKLSSLDSMMKITDDLMYKAKKEGKNQFQFELIS